MLFLQPRIILKWTRAFDRAGFQELFHVGGEGRFLSASLTFSSDAFEFNLLYILTLQETSLNFPLGWVDCNLLADKIGWGHIQPLNSEFPQEKAILPLPLKMKVSWASAPCGPKGTFWHRPWDPSLYNNPACHSTLTLQPLHGPATLLCFLVLESTKFTAPRASTHSCLPCTTFHTLTSQPSLPLTL